MIITNESSIINKSISSYIALGSFDGVHKGHLSLINKAVDLAKVNNGESIVYTFKNHPRDIIKSKGSPKLLIDNEEKINILEALSVDKIYFEEFNEKFMKHSPEEFIEYLCTRFNVKGIVVGFNYKFGYKNLGDTKLLKTLSHKYKYEIYIMPPSTYKEKIISSTNIRNELSRGHIGEANDMLTRPFMLSGEIINGKKIGRTIDFPTANLKYSKRSILPKIGVYYTSIEVNNNIYKGITSIGNNPTVNGGEITIETHILDFSGDIYGKNIKLYFLKWLRDNKKFDSIEALKFQLQQDKNIAKEEKTIYYNKTYLQL